MRSLISVFFFISVRVPISHFVSVCLGEGEKWIRLATDINYVGICAVPMFLRLIGCYSFAFMIYNLRRIFFLDWGKDYASQERVIVPILAADQTESDL